MREEWLINASEREREKGLSAIDKRFIFVGIVDVWVVRVREKESESDVALWSGELTLRCTGVLWFCGR